MRSSEKESLRAYFGITERRFSWNDKVKSTEWKKFKIDRN